MLYVAFLHHTIWHKQDGIAYMYQGKEFFDDNYHNSQVGTPVRDLIIYAVLENYFGNVNYLGIKFTTTVFYKFTFNIINRFH